jgi:hypothetical protein
MFLVITAATLPRIRVLVAAATVAANTCFGNVIAVAVYICRRPVVQHNQGAIARMLLDNASHH